MSRAPSAGTPESMTVDRWTSSDAGQLRNLLLVALTLATGSVDAISWLVLGKVFSAFMTGNLVFLGIVTGGAPGPDIVHVAISLVAFALGAAVSGRILRTNSRREHPWPIQVTMALAVTAILEAGVLGIWKSYGGHPSSHAIPVFIGMLSMAMGIQTVAVASLRVRGVFTTAATATLAFLMGDAAGLPHLRGEAQRLAIVVLGLVMGAGVGAFLVEKAPLWAPLFPLCVTMVVFSTAALVFNERQLSWAGPRTGNIGRWGR
jgi:uncharacterized membrane protein YoaK (UPF0700 family)